MRKLGIVLALVAASTIGFASSASASGHEEMVCSNFPTTESADAQAAENFGALGAEDSSAVGPILNGVGEGCIESSPNPVVCGVGEGLERLQPDNPISAGIRDGQDPIWEGCGGGPDECDPEVEDCCDPAVENCETTTTTQGNGNGGGGDDEVLANNATADGGLPRTGGELFAGLGFGLMSLGALARRFIG